MLDSDFFKFRIDYLQIRNLAIGHFVSFDDISIGGHLWRVNCYPNGNPKEDKGKYVSIFLKLVDRSKNVKAIFEAFMLRKDGMPCWSAERRDMQVYPTDGKGKGKGKGKDWRWRCLMQRSHILPHYTTNGHFTIMFGIIVVREDPLDAPPFDLQSHLGRLLDCTDDSDVSFVVDGKAFPAHRAVLAACSPVFKAQLLGSMADATMPSITLHDIVPETFKVMLRFIYVDSLPGDEEHGESLFDMTPHLLAAADRYALDHLKIICARKLWDIVSVDTVAATLACAVTYSCPELRKKCIAFLADDKNFRNAVLTDGFVQLVHQCPSIIAELRKTGK